MRTYKRPIQPVTIQDLQLLPGDFIRPPVKRVKRGRPKISRIRARQEGEGERRIYNCSVCLQPGHNRRICPNQPIEHGRAQRARDQLVEGEYSLILSIKLIIIDSEASTESPPSESPPLVEPPADFSDWDGFSDTLSFDSASDAFTDDHTDSEPEEIDSSWLYTVEEQDERIARRRYLRRRNRHIQERDRRRLSRELKEVDWSQLDDNLFDIWTTELQQDQDLDQQQVQILAEIQGQELDLDQDTRPQKRQYSSEALDPTDPELRERRYPLRKRQLTAKAAALII
jgi:hypothetical protein